jgi:UDP-N-acetylglucosamine 2-epimerase (non-hydrolysing)
LPQRNDFLPTSLPVKITLIAGARPNFMKIAPIIRAIDASNKAGNKPIMFRLVHTGQHYDEKLSHVFFKELGLPEPDVNLGAGSGTQAEQTARIMIEFEKDLSQNPTDLVVVVGDVTSTLACTIVAKKMNTKVAHVEGGIRSFDMAMPEEINRMVTDALADYFFTTTAVANENLQKVGIGAERIFFVGNTMIDSLNFSLDKLKRPEILDSIPEKSNGYWVLTLHRPSNVDDSEKLRTLLNLIDSEAKGRAIIFPVHPRTMKTLAGFSNEFKNIRPIAPLSYFEFIYLIKSSECVITDSGGIQEETTVLGIPCITLRNNTERPETVTIGTNELIGDDATKLKQALGKITAGHWKKGYIPEKWDGHAASRIVEGLLNL